MTPLASVFCLAFLCLVEAGETEGSEQLPPLRQQKTFISADVGESLILKCSYDSYSSKYFWYKQALGQKPRLFADIYKYTKNSTLHAEFKNDPRFTLRTTDWGNLLEISNLQTSDAGTYFCAWSVSFTFEFSEGTTVSVKSSHLSIGVSVRQSESEAVRAKDSMTLNCIIQTGTCDEELGVYWFKNLEEIFYTHGKNSRCEMKSVTKTRACVHAPNMKYLGQTHIGLHHCAVASCGHIVFGNGTKLDFQGDSRVVVSLIGALMVTTIMTVALTFQLYKIMKRNHPTERQEGVSAPSVTNTEGFQEAENLHYAALNVKRPKASRKETQTTNNECVYSSVKI